MDLTLIIFIIAAIVIAVRLYSVLGARTGHETRPEINLSPARARRAADPADETPEPEPAPALAPVSVAAEPLRAADPAFDERDFLAGARVAYEMIVEAFSAGDLKSVRRFLDGSVFEAFRTAAVDREARGEVSEVKFVGVEKAAIVKSDAREGALIAVAEFVSDQIRVIRNRQGEVISGDPSRIDRVVDRWTFARQIGDEDPNWILVATGGSA